MLYTTQLGGELLHRIHGRAGADIGPGGPSSEIALTPLKRLSVEAPADPVRLDERGERNHFALAVAGIPAVDAVRLHAVGRIALDIDGLPARC